MDAESQLKKLDFALGQLAPKGTWINEVLEKIWRAETTAEACKHAEEAKRVFFAIGIEEALWVGDRCAPDQEEQNAKVMAAPPEPQ